MLKNIINDKYYKFNKSYPLKFILELINAESAGSLSNENEYFFLI